MKSRLLAKILHTWIGLLAGISGATLQMPIPDAEMASRGPNLAGDRLQLARYDAAPVPKATRGARVLLSMRRINLDQWRAVARLQRWRDDRLLPSNVGGLAPSRYRLEGVFLAT